MYQRTLGYGPLNGQWDNSLFGNSALSADQSRNSRLTMVISLTLVIVVLVVYAVLFIFFPDLVFEGQPLPAGANQPAATASPAPNPLPGNLMLQDPRYWSTVDIVYYPFRMRMIEQ